MGMITSQITSLTIVYSAVYSDADQRKHQSSASLAFVRGIHWGPVNSPHKWPVMRKMSPFDDVIMSEPGGKQWQHHIQGLVSLMFRLILWWFQCHLHGWKQPVTGKWSCMQIYCGHCAVTAGTSWCAKRFSALIMLQEWLQIKDGYLLTWGCWYSRAD